ncbi:MAG: hypothetical protein PUP92_33965 [Rhizonema sp. PD38]|nr:hypothetical protein [Rhizonema sp. PD38]
MRQETEVRRQELLFQELSLLSLATSTDSGGNCPPSDRHGRLNFCVVLRALLPHSQRVKIVSEIRMS